LGTDPTVSNYDRNKFILNNPVFYIESIHTEINQAMVSNSVNNIMINDLQKVTSEVDLSGLAPSEKEEIKNILIQFTNEVQSKPLGCVIAKLKDKFKPYFQVASPYLQMLFSQFLRTL
jgi:hypothetical protein